MAVDQFRLEADELGALQDSARKEDEALIIVGIVLSAFLIEAISREILLVADKIDVDPFPGRMQKRSRNQIGADRNRKTPRNGIERIRASFNGFVAREEQGDSMPHAADD